MMSRGNVARFDGQANGSARVATRAYLPFLAPFRLLPLPLLFFTAPFAPIEPL